MSSDLSTLAQQMAAKKTYDEAWLVGLEIQSSEDHQFAVSVFRKVLEFGTAVARRAAAFWLTDEAEHVPAEVLLKMAADDDSEIRFHAAYGLSYARHPQTVDTLRRLLTDPAEEVRQTAVQSIYGANRLNQGEDSQILSAFENMLRDEPSSKVREEIVISLANFLKSTELRRATSLLEYALDDVTSIVREQALISLSVLRDEVWHHDDSLILSEEL